MAFFRFLIFYLGPKVVQTNRILFFNNCLAIFKRSLAALFLNKIDFAKAKTKYTLGVFPSRKC